jgi:hypothetical protein
MTDPKLQVVSTPENPTENPTGNPTENPTAYDPYAPENLRLDPSELEAISVERPITTVPVRMPGKQTYFRTRSGPEWRGNFAIIDLKDDREQYVVTAQLVPELSTEIVHKTLQLAITRAGNLFLLPLRLPGPDGRDMEWWRSMREHAKRAEERWIRVMANRENGAYDRLEGAKNLSEPEWPEGIDFWGIIRIAFRDYLIKDLNHPVIKKLRGLV